VKDALGSDQKPVYSASGPFIDTSVNGDAANGQQTTSKADFDQWYRNTQNVNKPYVIYFYFEPNAGVLTFESTAFFPLDGAGWGNGPNNHNFGFTTEVHTRFTYKGGETFAFTGDDDLWVFINHKLAIDLGGLHPKTSKQISLDAQAKALGIAVGSTYDLDLFHAERHTSASNFRVDTNLEFTNCGTIVPDVPVK
jgi:fibro-slime domain-containing protein